MSLRKRYQRLQLKASFLNLFWCQGSGHISPVDFQEARRIKLEKTSVDKQRTLKVKEVKEEYNQKEMAEVTSFEVKVENRSQSE